MTAQQSTITSILVVLLAFEIIVLLLVAVFPTVTDPGFVAFNKDVYIFLAPPSTVLLLGTLYTWLVRLAAREAQHRSAKFTRFLRFLLGPFQKTVESVKTPSVLSTADNVGILSRPWLSLIISIVASMLLAFDPYRPDLNPTGTLVGVDSPLYVGWINQMLARPLPQAIQYSFVQGLDGSRPLLLILLYLVALAGFSPSVIIEYLPIILAPLLSLSAYIFVRYGQGNAGLAGLASLFTTTSLYTSVGLWGGYYANWLALSFSFLFMTTLLVFSKRPSAATYIAMYVLSLALFLTHPWTWVLVLTVGLIFAVTVWRETRNRVHLGSIVGIIATGIIVDVVKSLAFATSSIETDIVTKGPAGIGTLFGFWNSLVQALLYTNGGLMADWLVLGMGLLAVFIFRFKEKFDRLLLLWTAVPSIPFLVLDSYNQSRIIYDLPIPILSTFGLVFLITSIGDKHWQGIFTAVMILAMANYALEAVIFRF